MAFLTLTHGGRRATGRPDFLAGNTRLRARLPALIDLTRTGTSAGAARGPVEGGVPGTVAEAGHGAVARAEAGRALLRQVAPAYQGSARETVAVLLARHDLRDTLALLRGALRRRTPRDRLRGVTAVGRVTPEIAAEVARAGEADAVVARLRGFGLPDPSTADQLEQAWSAFELHDDTEELEATIACATHLGWTAQLRGAGRASAAVAGLLADERDLANLVTVLRIPPAEKPRLLPPGRLGEDDLGAVARGDWTAVQRLRPAWARPAGSGPDPAPDAVAIERAAAAELSRRTAVWLRRGDVFTAEPAVAYVLAVEALSRPESPEEDQSTAVPGLGRTSGDRPIVEDAAAGGAG